MSRIPAQIARRALELRLAPLRETDGFARPVRGWIGAVREALGMSPAQLAARMGVSRPRIVRLEKDEMADAVTLRSLRHAAEAMDCTLVYALVPRKPLGDLVRDRAGEVADRQLARTGHTMKLENQAVDETRQQAGREQLIEDLLRDDRRLWEPL